MSLFGTSGPASDVNATTCQNCDRNVDHTEHIIRDVLTRGLADQDIQLDLLGEKIKT